DAEGRDAGPGVPDGGGPRAVCRYGPRRDLGGLPRGFVEPGQVAAEPAPEYAVGVAGLGDHVVALVPAHRMPVASLDHAVRPAAGYLHGAVLLLAAGGVIGKAVVGREVIELAGGLVVPAGPARAAVHRHHRALVRACDHVRRIGGVDPQDVVIVPAWGPHHDGKVFPAV